MRAWILALAYVRVARAVAAVFDELAHMTGPSKQTATKAHRRGYAPPLAWDDETIDDPATKPAGKRRSTWCRKVLTKHWPEVPKHDDVRTATGWWRSEPRPRVDVVAGGFPCQPISNAGRKLAQEDERWLWPDVAAVLRDLRPRYAILENVPALLGRGAGDVLGDLAALGYDAEWDCIPAAAVGAPHLRDRWFCVAHADGAGSPNGTAGAGGRSGEALWMEPERLGGEVADTEGNRRRARRSRRPPRSRPDGEGLPAQELADTDSVRWHGRPGVFGSGWRGQPPYSRRWATEPDVGRVAHGIPQRVDRIRGLGNAVVPQVSEYVGRLVMAAEGRAA